MYMIERNDITIVNDRIVTRDKLYDTCSTAVDTDGMSSDGDSNTFDGPRLSSDESYVKGAEPALVLGC